MNTLSVSTNNLSLQNTILLTLLLCVCGVLGNYLNVTLFFSISFIFGSTFAFLCLRILGFWPGLVVTLAASLVTYDLWSHPYAVIIFTAEYLFITAFRGRIKDIIILDMLYWLIIGAGLVWFFYHVQLNMDENSAKVIMLKQATNGVFNVILASLLYDFFKALSLKVMNPDWVKNKTAFNTVQLSDSLRNTILLFTLIAGSVPIISNIYNIQQLHESSLSDELTALNGEISQELISYENTLRQNGDTTSYQLSDVDTILKNSLVTLVKNDDVSILFNDITSDRTLYIGSTQFDLNQGSVEALDNNLGLWQPFGTMPSMQKWANGAYLTQQRLSFFNQAVEITLFHKTATVMNALEDAQIDTLVDLVYLIIIASVASWLVSQVLVQPISKLIRTSHKIQNNFEDPAEIKFPFFVFSEYNNLSHSLEIMARQISDAYDRVKSFKNTLEERVKERTADLERLSLVASQTSNAVVITNPAGQIEWVNEGFKRLSGYDKEEVLGKKPGDFLQGVETSAETVSYIRNALKRESFFNAELINYTKNGRAYWIEIQCNPLRDKQGNLTGFIAIESDITDRKIFETELKMERQKAEAANVAKSRFLATMSHEIRTPLNGILGMVQLLDKSSLSDEQREKTRSIYKSGTTLLNIINDVLDMSKIEAGEFELVTQPFDFAEVLNNAADTFNDSIKEKNLSISLHYPENENLHYMGDPFKLTQVVWNLVSNAIKFTSEGSISISLERHILENKYHNIVLTVSDTGKGIAPERLESVLLPFTQENVNITREFGGTGLGLSIVKNIVELMNGTINVESEVGKGTNFKISIPLETASNYEFNKVQKQKVVEQQLLDMNIKVLVAEDNEINAAIAKAFLGLINCDVDIAENGELAVEYCKNNRPDIIFMDIHMPKMDGITATKIIKEMTKEDPIPVVGLTADVFSENQSSFKDAGMDEIINKPFIESELHSAISKYVVKKTEGGKKHSKKSENTNTTEDKNMSDSTMKIGDDEQLDGFIDQLGAERVAPLLRSIPANIQSYVDMIVEGVSENDHEKVRDAAHAIKGASAQLFAVKLSHLAKEIEYAARENQDVSYLMPDFQEAIIETNVWWGSKID